MPSTRPPRILRHGSLRFVGLAGVSESTPDTRSKENEQQYQKRPIEEQAGDAAA